MEKTKVYLGKTARIILVADNPMYPAVLREFIKITDRDNVINLNRFRQNNILRNLRIKNLASSYIRISIVDYIKQNYIVRIAESTYMLNPYVCFNCTNPEFLTLCKNYDKYCQIAFANKKQKPKSKKKLDIPNAVKQAKNILNSSKPFE